MRLLLRDVRAKFERRLTFLENRFIEYVLCKDEIKSFDRSAHAQGLVANLWLYWNGFVREVVVNSCMGTITEAGVQTTWKIEWISEAYLLDRFRRAYLGVRTTSPAPLNGHWLEPTWGDLQKATQAIGIVNPTNAQSLISGFGLSGIVGPNHLKQTRNAIAHPSTGAFSAMSQIALSYENSSWRWPHDAILWTDRQTDDFAFLGWIYDMRLLAARSCQ